MQQRQNCRKEIGQILPVVAAACTRSLLRPLAFHPQNPHFLPSIPKDSSRPFVPSLAKKSPLGPATKYPDFHDPPSRQNRPKRHSYAPRGVSYTTRTDCRWVERRNSSTYLRGMTSISSGLAYWAEALPVSSGRPTHLELSPGNNIIPGYHICGTNVDAILLPVVLQPVSHFSGDELCTEYLGLYCLQ